MKSTISLALVQTRRLTFDVKSKSFATSLRFLLHSPTLASQYMPMHVRGKAVDIHEERKPSRFANQACIV